MVPPHVARLVWGKHIIFQKVAFKLSKVHTDHKGRYLTVIGQSRIMNWHLSLCI